MLYRLSEGLFRAGGIPKVAGRCYSCLLSLCCRLASIPRHSAYRKSAGSAVSETTLPLVGLPAIAMLYTGPPMAEVVGADGLKMLLAVAFLSLGQFACSQGVSGSVEGRVICNDGNFPARGASVELIPLARLLPNEASGSGPSQASPATSSDFAGVYILPAVEPGTCCRMGITRLSPKLTVQEKLKVPQPFLFRCLAVNE